MAEWFDKEYELSSLEMKRPGLTELLTKRASKEDILFHWGMIGAVASAAIIELIYLIPQLSAAGEALLWAHGIVGALLILGGLSYLIKYWRNEYFVLATDRIFLVDTAFLAAIAASGSIISLKVLGVLPPTAFGLEGIIHVTLTYTWLIISLFFNGAAKHALATIVWRIYGKEKVTANPLIFASACGRCGKCIEVCPLYEAYGKEDEAPALKLRMYLKKLTAENVNVEEKKKIAEEVYVCTLCGLCVGVCPYTFNFVEVYKKILAQTNMLYVQARISKRSS